MRPTFISMALAALTTLSPIAAHPGMGSTLKEIESRSPDSPPSSGPLGDLLTRGAVTPVGETIHDILVGTSNPQSSALPPRRRPPPSSPSCTSSSSPCCIWNHIASEMENLFRGRGGRCTSYARSAIRLGFHDAGTWNVTSTHGGADGSIVLSAGELSRRENNGLQEIGRVMQAWYKKYHPTHDISMADLIQFGATVATVVCPLGPRIRTFIGRKDSDIPSEPGLLPSPFMDATTMIEMFEAKTIRASGLVALVGAHTTSMQRFVDPERALDPQDSTPGVWDVLFYGQTLGTIWKPKRVFTIPSDKVLAEDERTTGEWRRFAGRGGQRAWNHDYAREYIRLSLLGVDNINELTECTSALPRGRGHFRPRNGRKVKGWLDGGEGWMSTRISEGEE